MLINLNRFSDSGEDTLGYLREGDRLLCFTLEDEARAIKVFGETRIPAGTYQLRLRKTGRLHGIYSERYSFHKGMLWIPEVPNFKWIMFHTGNNDDHTAGCPLVGDQPVTNSIEPGGDNLLRSVQAYKRIYPPIAQAIQKSSVILVVRDER